MSVKKTEKAARMSSAIGTKIRMFCNFVRFLGENMSTNSMRMSGRTI